MDEPAGADTGPVLHAPVRVQVEAFLDEHRQALHDCLDGLSEEQARASLVTSRTTLLGLVKHATFVEKVWFVEAVTGKSRHELGIVSGPDESFVLADDDTVENVRRAHREACEASRAAVAGIGLDEMLPGNRRGPLPLRWVYLHVLRELAQHCGHAEILREQVLDGTATVVALVDDGVRFVSRSEAKRVMRGLERFRRVELDFAGVEEVGQGFVDEALRVWPSQHPATVVTPTRMVGPVDFMIRRGLPRP